MLITTIERETGDDDLFSKSAPILTAASELAFHTMNTSALNAEELRRDNGIKVCVSEHVHSIVFIPIHSLISRLCKQLSVAV